MNENRVEKKFILGKYQEDFLKKILITNGFTKYFVPREISSIYLDTLNFDFAKDNINGVSKRKKIRFRWYNDDYSKIYLEEKNKQNFFVKKNISKAIDFATKKDLVQNLKEYLLNLDKIHNNFNYQFILKTNYLRSYWISNDKKIRATIDTNLNTSPINNLSRRFELNETILELKFSPSNEKFFRNLFIQNNFNLRSKKYSKYLQSFYILEESGLIN
jgi:SPX domain protein involved in polyphosphate accumulation